jgi:hypothetical protein
MSHVSYLTRIATPALALVVLAGCTSARTSHLDETTVAEGKPMKGRCSDTELMVVKNETGYPVRVFASEGHVNAPPGSTSEITTVQSGRADTIGYVRKDFKQIGYDIERSQDGTGLRQPVHGLSFRCIPAQVASTITR